MRSHIHAAAIAARALGAPVVASLVILLAPNAHSADQGRWTSLFNGKSLDDKAHCRHNVGLKGHVGLQIHPGQQLPIRFKDIQLRQLP